jgi:hypothetical protein
VNNSKVDWKKKLETNAGQPETEMKNNKPATRITRVRSEDAESDDMPLDQVVHHLSQEITKLKSEIGFKDDLEAIKAQLGNLYDLSICEQCGISSSFLATLKDNSESLGYELTALFDSNQPRFEFECPHCHKRTLKVTQRLTGKIVKADDLAKILEDSDMDNTPNGQPEAD